MKMLCKCGCGEEIEEKDYWKYKKKPDYIAGHNQRGKKWGMDRKEYLKEYRKNNREEINKYQSRNKAKRRVLWKEYFKEKYGENPQCEICGKILKWDSGKMSERVNFDHKNGDEPINLPPQNWIAGAAFNEKNIETWNKCNFGLLCCSCNNSLKTKNRKEHIKNIIKYVFGNEFYYNLFKDDHVGESLND